jgi:hypothetical protein
MRSPRQLSMTTEAIALFAAADVSRRTPTRVCCSQRPTPHLTHLTYLTHLTLPVDSLRRV